MYMSLIYALVAKSNPLEIRYIGKTADSSPKPRLNEHMRNALDKNTPWHVSRWIRKAILNGDEVLSIIVELDLSEEEALQREIFYIAHYRVLGYKLTNMTDGGDGSSGRITSEETRKKLSKSLKGKGVGRKFSEEHRRKIGESQVGRVFSEETRKKISDKAKGRMASSEARKKISDSVKKNWAEKEQRTGQKHTLESREKMSKAGKEKKTIR